jgi:hypothetical protein
MTRTAMLLWTNKLGSDVAGYRLVFTSVCLTRNMYFLCLMKPASLADGRKKSVLQAPVSNANMHAYACIPGYVRGCV